MLGTIRSYQKHILARQLLASACQPSGVYDNFHQALAMRLFTDPCCSTARWAPIHGPCCLPARPCVAAVPRHAWVAHPPGSRGSHRVRGLNGGGMPGIQDVIDQLRADPAIAPAFDSPRVQAALQEIRNDPSKAVAKYANDRQVMSVLQRLTAVGLTDVEGLGVLLAQLGTSASEVATSVFSDGALAAKLTQPRIRAAIAEIRQNPEAGMAKYENDADVMGVLDAVQAKLEAQGRVIDV